MREIIKSEDIRLNKAKYGDIINLPHHQSTKREPMKIEDRAAQFMPFAALTGFEQAIEESARVTEKRRILSEDQKNEIDFVLNRCLNEETKKPMVEIVYFVEDQIKEGGEYKKIVSKITKVDKEKSRIILENQIIINMKDIYIIQYV